MTPQMSTTGAYASVAAVVAAPAQDALPGMPRSLTQAWLTFLLPGTWVELARGQDPSCGFAKAQVDHVTSFGGSLTAPPVVRVYNVQPYQPDAILMALPIMADAEVDGKLWIPMGKLTVQPLPAAAAAADAEVEQQVPDAAFLPTVAAAAAGPVPTSRQVSAGKPSDSCR